MDIKFIVHCGQRYSINDLIGTAIKSMSHRELYQL